MYIGMWYVEDGRNGNASGMFSNELCTACMYIIRFSRVNSVIPFKHSIIHSDIEYIDAFFVIFQYNKKFYS